MEHDVLSPQPQSSTNICVVVGYGDTVKVAGARYPSKDRAREQESPPPPHIT